MGAIVTQSEVEDYLSTPVVRATYDDNNDGTIDSRSLALIISTSEALFSAYIRGIVALPLVSPIDPFAKYVVLQIIHCQSIKRFPEVFRQGLKICEDVEKLLEQIRKGELQIATPAADIDYGGPQVESFASRYIRERDFGPVAMSSFEFENDDD